jgi:hypothetical protein
MSERKHYKLTVEFDVTSEELPRITSAELDNLLDSFSSPGRQCMEEECIRHMVEQLLTNLIDRQLFWEYKEQEAATKEAFGMEGYRKQQRSLRPRVYVGSLALDIPPDTKTPCRPEKVPLAEGDCECDSSGYCYNRR